MASSFRVPSLLKPDHITLRRSTSSPAVPESSLQFISEAIYSAFKQPQTTPYIPSTSSPLLSYNSCSIKKVTFTAESHPSDTAESHPSDTAESHPSDTAKDNSKRPNKSTGHTTSSNMSHLNKSKIPKRTSRLSPSKDTSAIQKMSTVGHTKIPRISHPTCSSDSKAQESSITGHPSDSSNNSAVQITSKFTCDKIKKLMLSCCRSKVFNS